MSHIVAAGGTLPMGKFSLLPKEMKFFAFFEQEADNLVKMAQQLKDLFNTWQNVKERAIVLADMEQEGDAITHDIMTLLHRTFVTPFDREDISALAHELDVIADRIHAVADLVYLYKFEGSTDRAREFCDILLQAVVEVKGGVTELNGNIRKAEIHQRCVTINQIENYGDSVYRTTLVELFSHTDDMAYIIKWREIYQKMESAIDACEDVANILEGIAIKYS
jgi:uncharacterized protein